MDDKSIQELFEKLSLVMANQDQEGAAGGVDMGRFPQMGVPPALMNPKILSIILPLLQQGDINAFRQVCKQWNDIAEKGKSNEQPGPSGNGGGAGPSGGGGDAGPSSSH